MERGREKDEGNELRGRGWRKVATAKSRENNLRKEGEENEFLIRD